MASARVDRDRPRERFQRLGPAALADAELIALVLRSGDRRADAVSIARRLLERFGTLAAVARASMIEIASLPGVGPAKAASVLAACALADRVAGAKLEPGRAIGGPLAVHRHFDLRLGLRPQESFHALMLDGRHRLIAEQEVTVGTLNASLVHPREVFREAIRMAAAALVVVHNHPSGDPSPSGEDRRVTERLRAAGALLGIELIDHVIVASGGHFSFREAGLLGAPAGEAGGSGAGT